MRAKDFLRRPEKLELKLKNKMAEREQLHTLALRVTAGMGGERVKSSGSGQKMSSAVEKMVDMDEEINSLVDELVGIKREIASVIEQLTPTEYDLLHKRYIQGMTFYEIANQRGKVYSWVTTVHGRALKNVQSILDCMGESL